MEDNIYIVCVTTDLTYNPGNHERETMAAVRRVNICYFVAYVRILFVYQRSCICFLQTGEESLADAGRKRPL